MNRFDSVADLRLSPSLFTGVALVMAAVGLTTSVIGIRAVNEGFGTLAVGAISAGYYFGFLLGALGTPTILRRAGHIRSYAAFASLASAGLLAHLLTVHPVSWIVIRIITGAAMAGVFVVLESWLNETATNATRGRLLAIYSATSMAALALGQLLLTFASVDDFHLFVMGSLLLSFAVLPVTLARDCDPDGAPDSTRRTVPLSWLFNVAPLGLLGLVLGGMAQGALLGMGAVFAATIGFRVTAIAGFMALTVAGGLLADWPLGLLSDRVDRRVIIGVVGAAASAIAFAATTVDTTGGLLVVTFLLGALAFPLYPLSIAHVNDHLQPADMVPAASQLLAVNGLGAFAGPIIAAIAIQRAGPDGFFLALGGSTGALATCGAGYAWARRARVPIAASHYASVPHTATAQAAGLHPDASV